MLEDVSFERIIAWKRQLVLAFYGTKEKFITNHADVNEFESIYNEMIVPIYEEVYASCNVKQKLKLYMQKEHMDLFIRLKRIKNKLKRD